MPNRRSNDEEVCIFPNRRFGPVNCKAVRRTGETMIEVIIVAIAFMNTFALGLQVGRWMERRS